MIAKKRRVTHVQAIGFAIVALTILSGTSYGQAASQPSNPGAAPAKPAATVRTSLLPILPPKCGRVITADVVAIDQPFFLNRLGASNPSGMVFALRRDVVPTNCYDAGLDCTSDPVQLKNLQNNLAAGDAMLRREKRARPIVLRANVDDCLDIKFTNLLGPKPANPPPNPAQLNSAQPATRQASVRVMGMQLVKSIADDGSFVGANASSLADQGVSPGNSKTYRVYAEKEGNYMLYSQGADFGGHNGFSDGAQLTAGLFGSVNVEPKGSVWYRSQVTRDDLATATTGHKAGQPLINYGAVYPNGNKNAGVPVLQILNQKNEIVHTDLTAIVKPPKIVLPTNPNFAPNYAEPDRTQPFREFTIHYHEVFDAVQAFPDFYASNTANVLGGGQDSFAINYGTGGIGAEIIANRLGVGPEGPCTDCRFEEFFLSSWAAGEPATVVDKPANAPCTVSQLNNTFINGTANPCTVQGGTLTGGVMQPLRKATKAFYPDDPSNVYHSYINDHVQFRIVHAGSGITHVHHLHAHQWLHSPNSDKSTYMDSQMINPGTSYTLDIAYNGGGNRNKTVGDSIFHCHFYPHFAGGMWALWRTHDVFEEGTELDKNGVPTTGYNRALPDGEIPEGTPIPALVPMPGLAEAPMPAKVKIVPVDAPGLGFVAGYRSEMDPVDLAANKNPGFPFFIPGVAGARVPQPPLDFAKQGAQTLDGGLPRHVILSGKPQYPAPGGYTKLDFSKEVTFSNSYLLPEDGTKEEKIAMDFHSRCFHDSVTPEGLLSKFRTNGLPAIAGAPFADPALDPAFENKDREQVCTNNHAHAVPNALTKVYKAADIQLDIVFNKEGWHYPQSRIVTLWKDIVPTYKNERAPEPLFFRANSGDPIEYWLTNLVPDYYIVDDFQVRTPTDVIGQHIHLVKFDVTSSDGAANGFNYEDGSLSPDAVRAGIDAINQCGGIAGSLSAISPCGTAAGRTNLTAKPPPSEICSGPDCPKEWIGAQTNVQRWYADPLESLCPSPLGLKPCDDRTIRTVFTHDHFSPSTHQQTGLYAGLLVEPKGSLWFNSETGVKLHTRDDGGPTTWQANIQTANKADSYREFALEFQDFQLGYTVFSRQTADPDPSKGWSDPVRAISAPCQGPLPTFPNTCKSATPGVISTGPVPYGTQSVNYRSEPLPFRLSQYPAAGYAPASPQAYDLSFVFSSTQTRNPYVTQDASPNNPGQGTGRIAVFNVNKQPVPNSAIQSAILPAGGGQPWPQSPPCTLDLSKPCFRWPNPLTAGLDPGDPYTPVLRAYENDKVQVRVLVGAHMLGHGFNFHGLKWLFEPSEKNSGYRDTQQMGISEHFEYLFTVPRTNSQAVIADYLYMPDSSTYMPGLLDGTWGIFRAYKGKQGSLMPLPNNEPLAQGPSGTQPPAPTAPGTSCPTGQKVNKVFKVSAITSQQALATISNGALVLNSRGNANGFYNQIQSKLALMYVNTEDLQTQTVNGNSVSVLKPGVPVEPLILRANAGDCIELDLTNNMNPPPGAPNTFKLQQSIYGINLYPSQMAGIHPQLLSYDVTQNDGANVGLNPTQTVAPGQTRKYFWYAGLLSTDAAGKVTGTPVEFGAINLLPSDPLEQDSFGLVGAMVVEPQGATWTVDANTRSAAVVKHGPFHTNVYREFVAVVEDTLQQLSSASSSPPSGTHFQGAINYKAEPMDFRFSTTGFNVTDLSAAFSDTLVQSFSQTPIFSAAAGTPVHFLLLHPAGNQQQIFTIHGHIWQEEPFRNNSTRLGLNSRSQWMGSRDQLGPNSMANLLLPSAGGRFKVKGDYLYRTFPAGEVLRGLWGIMRVGSPGSDIVSIFKATQSGGNLIVQGINTVFVDDKVNAKNGKMAKVVTMHNGGPGGPVLGTQQVQFNGTWGFNLNGQPAITTVTVVSDLGGSKTVTIQAPKPLTAPAPEEFLPVDPTLRFQRRAPQRPPVTPPPTRPPQ